MERVLEEDWSDRRSKRVLKFTEQRLPVTDEECPEFTTVEEYESPESRDEHENLDDLELLFTSSRELKRLGKEGGELGRSARAMKRAMKDYKRLQRRGGDMSKIVNPPRDVTEQQLYFETHRLDSSKLALDLSNFKTKWSCRREELQFWSTTRFEVKNRASEAIRSKRLRADIQKATAGRHPDAGALQAEMMKDKASPSLKHISAWTASGNFYDGAGTDCVGNSACNAHIIFLLDFTKGLAIPVLSPTNEASYKLFQCLLRRRLAHLKLPSRQERR